MATGRPDMPPTVGFNHPDHVPAFTSLQCKLMPSADSRIARVKIGKSRTSGGTGAVKASLAAVPGASASDAFSTVLLWNFHVCQRVSAKLLSCGRTR